MHSAPRSAPWWRRHEQLYLQLCDPSLSSEALRQLMRLLARTDLHFLIDQVLGRTDINHPWLIDRCYEVQHSPNGYLDLWAREHYKSTIITWAKTIQDVLASHGEDPLPQWRGVEPTFGFFSHIRPIAKKFARQVKVEFESNRLLRWLFPDVLWEEPRRQAPVWSLDEGLVVRRHGNPKEATIEAWGLVDGQPTAAHFNVCVYDDVVTRRSVYTPGAIEATTAAWELSTNLGTRGGVSRYIGTRYHFNDTYGEIMRRGVVTPRIYPATVDGRTESAPVLLSHEELKAKRIAQGSFTFSCQMLQNPKADEKQGFKLEDIRHYRTDLQSHQSEEQWHRQFNKYIIVDPANEKHKRSDYTAGVVIGLGPDRNYYLLDMWRRRLNLTERAQLLMMKHRQWRPLAVGYEKYGKDSDITHIQYVMELEQYRFQIVALGGPLGNFERVRRLIPDHEAHRWYYPAHMHRAGDDGLEVDMMQVFLREEFEPFPVGVHADIMDAQSRIYDEGVEGWHPTFPEERSVRSNFRPDYTGYV